MLETVATSAKKGTKWVRATIPEGIAEFLKVKPGDTLGWEMEVTPDGRRVAIMFRAESIADVSVARRK